MTYRFLLNREKSGMLTERVLNPPVIEVMVFNHSQALVEPETVAG